MWLIYPSSPPPPRLSISILHPSSLYPHSSFLALCQPPDIPKRHHLTPLSIIFLSSSASSFFHSSSDADATAVRTTILRIAVIPGIIHTGQSLGAPNTRESTAEQRLDADAAAVGTSILRVAIIARVVNADLVLVGARDRGETAAEGASVEACAADGDLVGQAFINLGGGSPGDGSSRSGGKEGKESSLEEHFGVGLRGLCLETVSN